MTRGPQKIAPGFTFIELIITLAIVAVLATLAAPSYSAFIEKRKITGGAEELAAFMMLARSEAVKRNQPTTVSFFRDNDTDYWCLGMILGEEACTCTLSSVDEENVPEGILYCALNKYTGDVSLIEPQIISSSDHSELNLITVKTDSGDDLASGDDIALTYDPVRGILTDIDHSSSLFIASSNSAYLLEVSISATGTVSICTDSSKSVSGFKLCPTVQ